MTKAERDEYLKWSTPDGYGEDGEELFTAGIDFERKRILPLVASMLGHTEHFDREGTRGKNCPVCIDQRGVIAKIETGEQ